MATTKQARTNSGLAQYTGAWGRVEVNHLLKRTNFGARVADAEYFAGRTMSQAVDEILNIDYTTPAPPINNYNGSNADPNIAAGQTWVNDFNGLLNGSRRASFKRWWTGLMINHDRTIKEKMTLFWHNHFATETVVYGWANYAYRQNELFRSNSVKNYRTLVKEISIDPAMLIYLNGNRNTKSAPDENYSRELMELFTLGKGPNSKYTEHDVIEAAKVLTGFRVNNATGTVYFDDTRHDTTDKTFSSFFGTNTITGKTGQNGATELDDLINMIFLQPEVSKHMVRKLYKWFVYYDIDDDTELNVINPLSAIFRNNNYDVKPVLEALFKSEHFFDVANRGALIKSPVDFTVGLCRNFDIEFPPATDYVNQYNAWNLMYYYGMAILQQNIGDPPSVAGWSPYYQVPQFHEIWINSDTLPYRNILTDILIANGYGVGSYRLKVDTLSFAKSIGTATARIPNDLIDYLLVFMHTLEVNSDQKDFMRSILLGGNVNDSYWTDAWDDYYADQNNTQLQSVVSSRLAFLLKYLMNLSEYQLS
jgi:uncharacterized protein (DUF1800 family)